MCMLASWFDADGRLFLALVLLFGRIALRVRLPVVHALLHLSACFVVYVLWYALGGVALYLLLVWGAGDCSGPLRAYDLHCFIAFPACSCFALLCRLE